MISLEFSPDVERAVRLDERMRSHLCESLDYLGSCMAAIDPVRSGALVGVAEAGRKGVILSPAVFGLYYDIARELIAQDLEAASTLIDELRQVEPGCAGATEILPLDALPLATRARYQRLMDTDPKTPFRILSPDPAQCETLRARFVAALERLEALAPALVGEFRAIVRQVVLVEGDPGLGYEFAGGSCYMLWGALFINVGRHDDELALMGAIAHELTHSLLFGFTIEEPLVLNDLEQRYESPLRDDPRPMDGLFHATFVSARMHWALSRIAESPLVEQTQSRLAAEGVLRLRRSFEGGLAVVRRHGELSPTGRALIDGAERYMSAFAA